MKQVHFVAAASVTLVLSALFSSAISKSANAIEISDRC